MKKMNNILYLTTVGVISSITPTSSNAQTFYQCMPLSCSDGQYIKDGKCTSCPAGTYQKGNDRATSCSKCGAGTYSSTGASSCSTCPAGYYCPGNSDKISCSSGYYQNETGKTSCKSCPTTTFNYKLRYNDNVSSTSIICSSSYIKYYSNTVTVSEFNKTYVTNIPKDNIRFNYICGSTVLSIDDPKYSSESNDRTKLYQNLIYITKNSCNKVTGKSSYTFTTGGCGDNPKNFEK